MRLSLRSKLLLPILPLLVVLAFLFFTALLPYQRVKTDINNLRPDVSKTVALGDLGIALSRQMTQYYKLIASGGAEDGFQQALNNTQQSLERLRKEMALQTGSEQDAEASHAVEEMAGQYAELNRLCQTGLELAKRDQRDKTLNLIKTKVEPLLEDSLRIKFEQLDAKNGIEFDEDLARLRGHSDDLITFSRSDLQSNITNMKGHITDTLLVFTLARNFNRQMEEYYFLILAQDDNVDGIEAARRTASQALEAWKINEGGGVGQRTTASKDLEDVERVERDLIKLNQLADPIPDLAKRGETAQALRLLTDKIEPIAHGQLADILDESVRHEGQALAEGLDNAIKSGSRMQFGLGVFSLLVLVIGIGAPWFLSKTIISPILELMKAASKVGSGNLDTRVSVTSKGELSQLATTFNQMTEALKKSSDSLHEANRELEQRVADRTVELNDSNKQLQVELVERNLIEDALRESERKYREIFESAVEGIFQTRPGGGFITANPALARMLGFETPEELIRARAQAIGGTYYVHPERRAELKRLLDQHDTVRGFEFEAYRKDGTKIWMSDNVRAVRDASGNLLYYEGTVEDITERKQMEEALRRSEMDLADFFENAAMGLHWVDSDGTVLRVNQAELDLLGYTRDECVGHNIAEFHADRDVVKDILDRLRAGEVLRDYEARLRCKDGSIKYGCINSSVYWEGGRFVHSRCFTRNIAERKLQEEALHESEAMLRQSQRVAVLGHYVLDVTTGFWTNSQVLDEIFGIDATYTKNVEGWLDIVHPEQRDEMHAYLRDHVLKERNSFDREYRIVRVNDSAVRWVHGLGNLEFNAEGQPARMFGVIQDITDRKQIEDELRESEERYRDLVENSRELICTHDLDGLILSANPAAAASVGYDLAEYVGKKTIRDLLAPEVRDQFDKYMARLRKEGATSGIMLVQTRSGERRLWEYYNSLRTEGVDTPIVRGMARDITEQRRAEKAMSDLRRELELTMNSMEEGIHRVDLQGNIVFENAAAARMLGWKGTELLGKRGHPTMHHTRQDGTSYPQEECPIYATFRDGVSRHIADEVFWRRDGTSFPVEYTTAPMRADQDEIVATVVTFRDITDRKRAEAALRESEERYRELFENDKDAIYVHDLRGAYTSINRAAEILSGYPRAEILGRHFWDFVAPEYKKQVRENLCKKLKETGETNYEVEIINRDGERVPVEVSSRLIYENGVAVGVQGSARDISERKRAQEALLIYSRRLIAAEEAERGRIARELHDQIGQMLTALKLNLHAIQSARDEAEARLLIEDNLKMIDEALEQVRNLSVDIRPLLLDDLGLVTALQWYVDHQAQRTGVRAEFACDSLDADERFSSELETACFRIAQESLTNVVRHARAKVVRVRLSRNSDYLTLLIEDDGVGFDIKALQGHAVVSATLGLQGMQERAHAIGGRIKIDSGTDKGTQVFVELPIAMPNGREPELQNE